MKIKIGCCHKMAGLKKVYCIALFRYREARKQCRDCSNNYLLKDVVTTRKDTLKNMMIMIKEEYYKWHG